ncbi:MAG: DUF3137 domain-containing protein [Bacteroidales bacterium]|nr:DUF3137 domain-containing protein [Bacteroidales bacterium]
MKSFEDIISSGELNIPEIENHRLQQLSELQKRNIKGFMFWGIVFFSATPLSTMFYNGWFLVAGFVMGLIAFIIIRGGGIKRKLYLTIKEKVIKKLIEAISPDFEYFPQKHVSREMFKKSQFIKHYSYYKGEDLFVGIYNNIYVEYSELHISQKRDKSTVTVFKGPFYYIQTKNNFEGRTVVVPDFAEKLLGKFGRALQKMNFSRDALIKIDNEVFEKQFAVFSSNESEAKLILSDELISFLLREKSKAKQVYFGFSKNEIYFGIYNSKDLYKIDVKTEINEQSIRPYYDELAQNLNLIEELYNIVNSLENNIFTKKSN